MIYMNEIQRNLNEVMCPEQLFESFPGRVLAR
jgi:hypothetical protein